MTNPKKQSPWAWIPSLYFAEGIPYVIVMTLSVIMYKRLGVSNSDIALYTSWLYLPWVIKPIWSPIVDLLKTKRYWIIMMQLFIGAGLAGVAFTIPIPNYFQYTLAFFWLLAFSSATHDIAADGFYMLGLDQGNQAFFVGIRSTFYRLAMLTGQGLIVILAGAVEANTGPEPIYFTVKADTTFQVILPDLPSIQTVNEKKEGFVFTNNINIPIGKLEKVKTDSLIQKVKELNVTNGFYIDENAPGNLEFAEPGLWSKYVSTPLKKFLKKYFSDKQGEVKKNTAPGTGIVALRLSSKPEAGQTFVLNINRDAGDKNINVIEGSRFEFSETNWDKTAYIVLQTDPKLNRAVDTIFVGRSGNLKLAWTIAFISLAILFVLFFIYHRWMLPRPDSDVALKPQGKTGFWRDFGETFTTFFKKQNIGVILAFLLLYRLGESQLVKMASPFLLDSTETGGLGLATGDLGFVYGTVGIIALSLGGIIGGILVARNGLKYWLWWMVLAMNLPNLVYVYLSYAMPGALSIIAISVAIEQFGYGFGFTAYLMYTIYVAEGKHKTAHYAIATGFMAFGMMLPGMISGWIQDIIGYENFFIWVIICTIPAFVVTAFVKIPADFGLKKKNQDQVSN